MRYHTVLAITMNRFRFPTLTLALLLNLPLTACGVAQVEADSPPRLIENIAYIQTSKLKAHLADLYLPESGKGKVPVIVWIHGGAWLAGDKAPAPITELIARGYAVAAINYRLTDEHKFPAQIHDCKAAVRWLRSSALKYNLDPDRIGVFGVSAGGHLAALLGVTTNLPQFEGNMGEKGQASNVQAVVDWCGPSDMFTIGAQEGPDSQLDFDSPRSPVRRLLGGKVQKNKVLAMQASPIFFASADDPPFLIMHGDKDTVVPPQQSVELANALKAKGVDCTLEMVKGADHSFFTHETMDRVGDFFDKHLKSPLSTLPKP